MAQSICRPQTCWLDHDNVESWLSLCSSCRHPYYLRKDIKKIKNNIYTLRNVRLFSVPNFWVEAVGTLSLVLLTQCWVDLVALSCWVVSWVVCWVTLLKVWHTVTQLLAYCNSAAGSFLIQKNPKNNTCLWAVFFLDRQTGRIQWNDKKRVVFSL